MLLHLFHFSPDDAPVWLFLAAAGVLILALALVVWSALQPDLEESFRATTPVPGADDDRPIVI